MAVDQVIIQFGEAGIAALSGKIAGLRARIEALQAVAARAAAAISPAYGAGGLGRPLAGSEWAAKQAIALSGQANALEAYSRAAMAAAVPAYQLQANAEKLRATYATLLMPSERFGTYIAVAGENSRIAAQSLTGYAARLRDLEDRLKILKGLAAQPIGIFGGGGPAGLAAQANLQGAIVRTEQSIQRLKTQMIEIAPKTINWGSVIRSTGVSIGHLASNIDHAVGRMIYLGFTLSGLSTMFFMAMKGLTDLGTTSMIANQQFGKTAEILGTTANQLLPKLEKASMGMIAKFDLMRMTNAALIAGWKPTEEQILTLVEAATKLGKTYGRDVNEAYQRLIFSITKGERRLLDELGITISAREAYDEYAKSINSTSDELTRVQKVQAMGSLVTESAATALKKLDTVNWEQVSSIGKLDSMWTNFTTTLANVFVESGAAKVFFDTLESALQNLQEYFKTAEGKQFFVDLANAIKGLIPVLTLLGTILKWLAENIESVVKALIGIKIGDVLSEAAPFISALGGIIGSIFGGPAGAAIGSGIGYGVTKTLPAIFAAGGWFGGISMAPRETGRGISEAVNGSLSPLREGTRELVRYVSNGLIQEAPYSLHA